MLIKEFRWITWRYDKTCLKCLEFVTISWKYKLMICIDWIFALAKYLLAHIKFYYWHYVFPQTFLFLIFRLLFKAFKVCKLIVCFKQTTGKHGKTFRAKGEGRNEIKCLKIKNKTSIQDGAELGLFMTFSWACVFFW